MIADGTLARADWRRSAEDAWSAAKALASRNDTDAHLSVRSQNVTAGMSAGLAIGLAALSELLEVELPPFFATGRVLWPLGFAEGGRAVSQKGGYLDRQAGTAGERATLIAPPLVGSTSFENVHLIEATDLAAAFASLAPEDAELVLARSALHWPLSWLEGIVQDLHDPFVVVLSDRAEETTRTPGGIRLVRLAHAGAPFAFFGGGGQLYWGTFLDPPATRTSDLEPMWKRAFAAGPGRFDRSAACAPLGRFASD